MRFILPGLAVWLALFHIDAQNTSSIVTGAPLPGLVTKGPAFSNGKAAIINSHGTLDAASGTGSNCVHVDGSSAGCGSGGGSGSIATTTGTLVGDGAGNAISAIGTPGNCVHVDGSNAACSSGGGGMAAQLGDFAIVATDAGGADVTLTLGANCSPTVPCNVHLGSTVFTLSGPVAAVLSGSGTGNVYFYLDSTGTLTAGYDASLTLACSGVCTGISAITAFPANGFPVWLWHATNGTWDTGGTDERAFLGWKNVTTGLGMQSTESQGTTTILADQTLIALRVPSPVTSGDTCSAGTWAMDTSYYYLCIAANTWKRSSLSSW